MPPLPHPDVPDLISLTDLLMDASMAETVLQTLRWPKGRPTCPHCGGRQCYRLTCLRSGGVRFKCAACRKQYSPRRNTVMERSNVPTGRWLVALALATGTPVAGLPARIERHTGVSYKTAWSMVQRLKASPQDPLLLAMHRAVERGRIDFITTERGFPRPVRRPSGPQATLAQMATT
ncbi:transposase [Roseospira visakhapatnamensis]|uniref:Transposase-like protein n=1 Tax=Roseospira visakhapatnamensis TaxID=390880 RepID=A0A7W6RDA1_9PROT|nr:transposase [Roseospira visakhapatnamensis]MBB4266456.1 transposase-like protein [Roseospira visakhapatnamensis]